MTVSNTLPVTQAIKNNFKTFVNADGAVGTTLTTSPSNTKLLLTAGANGSTLKGLIVSSDDSSAKVLVLYLSDDGGTTKYCIGTINVPINSGATGAIVNVDCLSNPYLIGLCIDQGGKNVIPLAPNVQLFIGVQAAVTAAKFVIISAFAEDF